MSILDDRDHGLRLSGSRSKTEISFYVDSILFHWQYKLNIMNETSASKATVVQKSKNPGTVIIFSEAMTRQTLKKTQLIHISIHN